MTVQGLAPQCSRNATAHFLITNLRLARRKSTMPYQARSLVPLPNRIRSAWANLGPRPLRRAKRVRLGDGAKLLPGPLIACLR